MPTFILYSNYDKLHFLYACGSHVLTLECLYDCLLHNMFLFCRNKLILIHIHLVSCTPCLQHMVYHIKDLRCYLMIVCVSRKQHHYKMSQNCTTCIAQHEPLDSMLTDLVVKNTHGLINIVVVAKYINF